MVQFNAQMINNNNKDIKEDFLMATKLTITVTRPDENIPFYDQTPEWEADTELQDIATKHSNLIADGVIEMTNFYLDQLTKKTIITITDIDAYKVALGLPAGPLPKTQFSENVDAYNTLHGITQEVVEETV